MKLHIIPVLIFTKLKGLPPPQYLGQGPPMSFSTVLINDFLAIKPPILSGHATPMSTFQLQTALSIPNIISHLNGSDPI